MVFIIISRRGPAYPIRSIRSDKYKLILNLIPDNDYYIKWMMNPKDKGLYSTWLENAKENPEAKFLTDRISKRPDIEFYDIKNDPFELKNLATDSGFRDVIKEMNQELSAWMERQGDKGIGMDRPIDKPRVYFKQSFSSSGDKNDFVGSGQNQFDGLVSNGDSKIDIQNDKLRLVKQSGVTNGLAITKTTKPFNPGAIGGFLKFEMQVNVSNNSTSGNLSKGFLFSIGAGMSGTHVGDPTIGLIHSRLYITPTDTEGGFVIQAGGPSTPVMTSMPIYGSKKIVWYINNTGSFADYIAPDGKQSRVKNDASDIWIVDRTNATLIVDDVPATSPDVIGLRQFKISCNAEFSAVLELDDVTISGEKVIELPASLLTYTQNKFYSDDTDKPRISCYVSTYPLQKQ